jgi:protein-tyrosine phosphatase
VIDLHSHILPGIDDGPETLEASVEMARAAVEDGIEIVAATPHVRSDFPTTAAEMERLVGEVEAALAEQSIPLQLRTGGEIALDELAVLGDEELRRFSLGGNGRYLLVEFPYHGWPLHVHNLIDAMGRRGFAIVFAHPERNAEIQRRPAELRPLVDAGALVQLTAASVDGRLGRRARRASFRLLELDLAHLLASDAHSPSLRQIGLGAATREIGDVDLAHWLTVVAPAAVLRGEAPPARPSTKRGLRRAWRR